MTPNRAKRNEIKDDNKAKTVFFLLYFGAFSLPFEASFLAKKAPKSKPQTKLKSKPQTAVS
ncbi:hypothetical protein [Hugenholtzia roseola]|uniref:hypothetical protein n=1 Tax=Hugenholtzia roseola TaxID=1002 RepID=UPI0012B5A3F2|nr:hypothetical protein [Hugenholtzia roseola]